MSFSHQNAPPPAAGATAPALNALIATSHPLAAQAGLEMLRRGGNAVDAAVAASAVLSVVEPMSTALGGDTFALLYDHATRTVRGLNGSGRSPAALSLECLETRGLGSLPEQSGLSVMVPGSVRAWADCVRTHGRLGWDIVLGPAIDCAEQGFVVTPVVSTIWARHSQKLSRHSETARVFLPGGQVPKVGSRFCNPDLGRTLRLLAEAGPDEFYGGSLAEKIAHAVQAAGGVLSAADLQEHHSDWVPPLSVQYRGYEILQMPPNSQGVVVLLTLTMLEQQALSSYQHNSSAYVHVLVEALKPAFLAAGHSLADPGFCPEIARLLSAESVEDCRRTIDETRAQFVDAGEPPETSDTVYVAVVDQDRNAVSFISSLYRHFGSGITVPSTGTLLHNRAIGFCYDPGHPNVLAPRKRCYHTLAPGMVLKDKSVGSVLGVVGAYMQPQGQVQLLASTIDFNMDPQAALDAPRFRFVRGLDVSLERGFPERVRRELAGRGHNVLPGEYADGYGGGQMIRVTNEGLWGGSDRRKDACALGY